MIGRSEKKRIITIAALLYLLLLLDSGFYFAAKGGIFLYAQAILGVMLALICKVHIPKNVLLIAYSLIFLVLIGTTVSGDSIRNLTVSTIELSTGFLIACLFTSERSRDVEKALRIIMMAICICSLFAFLLTAVRFNAVRYLPVFESSNNTRCYFWGLSFTYVPGKYYIARNLGIFWEPGAFQTYIILALTHELFAGRSWLPRTVYTVTLLTTLSTTGIVCLLLIWIIYVFSTGNRRDGILLFILLLCIFLLLYFRWDFLPKSIRFNLVEKIQSVFYGNTRDYITVTTRLNSIKYGIELLLQNPLGGIGRGLETLKSAAGNNIVSCTPVNWMLQYGIVFGSIAFVGIYRFLYKISNSTLIRMGLFSVILISVSTEAFNISPTFFFLVFLGYDAKSGISQSKKRKSD